ncbi:YolD-like family protein [Lysinibacillus telephonicus]|uniref:YolD-like family protein n=1 Tax=Lysinibacillus telephonicus TaxID=1714840 RepID=UPI0031FDCD1D
MSNTINPLKKPGSTKKSKEQKHLPRDEFELEEIAYILSEALEQGSIKVFTIYKQERPLKGIVTKMDGNTKLIHIKDQMHQIHKIHFLDILTISEVE